MQLYIVRHGETEWNQQYRYYGKSDILLNDKGKEQANHVGELLKDIVFDTVYVSTLKRAIQTKELIVGKQAKTATMIHTEYLKEQDLGIFEGYTYKELEHLFPKELKQWNENFKGAPHGGESFYDVYERVSQFCTNQLEINRTKPSQVVGEKNNTMLWEVSKKKEKENVLIISHMGIIRCLLVILLGMQEDAIWNFTLEQGAYTRIDIEDGYAIIKKINQS